MNEDDLRTVQDNYNEIFEINSAIVDFVRKKVLDLRGAAELHREIADKYDEIADSIAEMSLRSAEALATGMAIEMGLRDLDEEDEEDE